MALNNQTGKTAAVDSITRKPEPGSVSEEEEEEEELEKLEAEVKEMGKKVLEYRTTLPDQLKTTLASILSAQRPVIPDIDSGSDPGPAGESIPGLGWQVTSGKLALLTEEDQKIAEKVGLLKAKIASNISAMPLVLKRMKECVSKIDSLDSSNGNIHPAFRRKTS